MIIQLIMAFLGTYAFCFLFNTPKNQLFYCGTVGTIAWLVYSLTTNITSTVSATFFATASVTLICRILARTRKMPITIFLVGGIMPLVPGSAIYDTMYNIIIGESIMAMTTGIYTFKIAGVIGIGIIIILSFPAKWFAVFQNGTTA